MAIRTEQVQEIKWLIRDTDYDSVPDDLCIILFHDGQKKQGHVLFKDKRIWFAIESHDVETTKMEMSAPLKEIKIRVGENHNFIKIFYPVAPIIGIALIVMVTQYVANQRDDKDDRIKIGQRELEKKESEKRSKSEADIMRLVNNMAANGKDIK